MKTWCQVEMSPSVLIDMKGKVCIVTGANSGIGKETALALAGMGATVIMVVRSMKRGERAKSEIISQTTNASIDLMICDMSSMESIRHFVAEFKHKYTRLDVLINNAGAFFNNREVTAEGFERTVAVNYLGPFLLTHELLPLLKTSAPSRIINVSSGLHKSGKIDFNSAENYSGMRAYSNAKLMVIMFTYELARHLEGTGVTVNVLEPGFVATNIGKNSGSLLTTIMYKLVRPMQINAKKGSETSIYLASSDEVKYTTGKCFAKKQETNSAPTTYDKQLQKAVWDETNEMLGLAPN